MRTSSLYWPVMSAALLSSRLLAELGLQLVLVISVNVGVGPPGGGHIAIVVLFLPYL